MDMNKIEFEKKIYEFEKLKSTNDWMIENLKKINFKEGNIVFTLNQSDGRGMRNSKWFSEKNKSLTFSLLLKPNFLKLDYLFDLSICVSISIIEVLISSPLMSTTPSFAFLNIFFEAFDIPLILKKMVDENISITEMKQMRTLEELFLGLTK